MDLRKIMILVRDDDKTAEIVDYESKNGKVNVTFQSGKSYPYNKDNVVVLKSPIVIDLKSNAAYVNGFPVYEPKLILNFGLRIRIIKNSGDALTVEPESFLLVPDGTSSHDACQTLDYLRDISQYTSSKPEEDVFLKQEMENLTFVHPESILSHYLNGRPIEERKPDMDGIIFPFYFNLSQKNALENALTSSVSVIDGPPGTGKTQTILNIITNLVAVQRKSVAVVANNNEAVKNVIEKMAGQGYGFLTALLGKKTNQDAFFADMPIAHVAGWDCEEKQNELIQQIEKLNKKLNKLLGTARMKAQLCQELRAWRLEQEHFEEYYIRQNVEEIIKLPLFKAAPEKIVSFLADTSLAKDLKQSNKYRLLYKLKLLLKYRIFDHKQLQEQEVSIFLSLQRIFYQRQIQKLERKIAALERRLNKASFDVRLKEHQQLSEKLFRKCLYHSHIGLQRPDFTKKSFKVRFNEFIKVFPVILSTTHSLRRSIPKNYLLDYVIIDEASQVDLLTGSLALSCCRNVIIVGDVKQLPQIIDRKIEPMLKTTPSHHVYDYFQHNILSSIISLYGNSLPRKILREHYRSHPQIIEFCNQKYYDGELIPYTNPDLSALPLMIYKTSEGNHMRRVTRGEKKGNYNQRELDVTIEEILKNPDMEDYENIGFVTPYRKQADKAAQLLPGSVESDTVHKYQGREKKIMIMSTVLDSSRDGSMGVKFVDDPQMINVAVSRAVEQFVLITDHSLFFKRGKNISDLIRYIQYSTLDENVIESNIVSIFDLLYRQFSSKLLSLKAKMDKNACFQSEEALRVLLEDILADPQYNRYTYVQEMRLRNLLNTIDLLTPEELNFVNRSSLDFVVYYKQDKACALVIEVDGFAFHENNPEQLRRDALKDTILMKYKVPILRLATNGSRERERIQETLDAL